MELKDVCLVIGLFAVSGLCFYQIEVIEDHEDAYLELENKHNLMKTNLESHIEYCMRDVSRMYADRLARDCYLRGFSSFDADRRQCCKWVNSTKVCVGWLTVVFNESIVVEQYNMERGNVSIGVESLYDDELIIYLYDFPNERGCYMSDYDGYVEIICRRW